MSHLIVGSFQTHSSFILIKLKYEQGDRHIKCKDRNILQLIASFAITASLDSPFIFEGWNNCFIQETQRVFRHGFKLQNATTIAAATGFGVTVSASGLQLRSHQPASVSVIPWCSGNQQPLQVNAYLPNEVANASIIQDEQVKKRKVNKGLPEHSQSPHEFIRPPYQSFWKQYFLSHTFIDHKDCNWLVIHGKTSSFL